MQYSRWTLQFKWVCQVLVGDLYSFGGWLMYNTSGSWCDLYSISGWSETISGCYVQFHWVVYTD